MSDVIYKYPLLWDARGISTIEAPPGRLLKIAMQERTPTAWIIHDIDRPKAHWRFRAVMTGEKLEDGFRNEWTYVDTLFVDWLVLHVYEQLILELKVQV